MTDAELQQAIETMLQRPVYFRDVLDGLAGASYRSVLRAWSNVRTRRALDRDEHGRYRLAGFDKRGS